MAATRRTAASLRGPNKPHPSVWPSPASTYVQPHLRLSGSASSGSSVAELRAGRGQERTARRAGEEKLIGANPENTRALSDARSAAERAFLDVLRTPTLTAPGPLSSRGAARPPGRLSSRTGAEEE
jgi:hypothetical protein